MKTNKKLPYHPITLKWSLNPYQKYLWLLWWLVSVRRMTDRRQLYNESAHCTDVKLVRASHASGTSAKGGGHKTTLSASTSMHANLFTPICHERIHALFSVNISHLFLLKYTSMGSYFEIKGFRWKLMKFSVFSSKISENSWRLQFFSALYGLLMAFSPPIPPKFH